MLTTRKSRGTEVNFTLKEYTATSQWKGKLVHAV